MQVLPPIRWDHLLALTGPFGLYEHAEYSSPRVSEGYTTDDNARALVVLTGPTDEKSPPITPYLDYVVGGRVLAGWRNRMSETGAWTDLRGPDDAHGRAVWGLGVALSRGVTDTDTAAAFLAGLDLDTTHPRANCYAVLGACHAHEAGIFTAEIDGFLNRVKGQLPRGGGVWPETVLTYDNARLPEALIRMGSALDDDTLTEDGLNMLEWLVESEMRETGFSFTPVGGRRRDRPGPGFDQQPLEAWAMADACLAALTVDRDRTWLEPLQGAVEWFMGRNDVGAILYDPSTGAGYDGLTIDGPNLNQGAESTLSALGSIQALRTARDSLLSVKA